MPIEELIERYFSADTTVSEERQLREYFASDRVAPHLLKYRTMFEVLSVQDTPAEDAKRTGTTRSRVVAFYRTLRPLMRAAACVAVVLAVVMVGEQGMRETSSTTFVTPSGSQNVGIAVSEWDGMQIIECPTDTVGTADE